MDFISRLRKFMDSNGISSSQFADICGIPRPTLSQLLNGRNKKVSDEIITKIHEAYPGLSVTWLMFGEGEMGANANTQFSEAQNGLFDNPSELQTSDIQHIRDGIQMQNGVRDFGTNKFESQFQAQNMLKTAQTGQPATTSGGKPSGSSRRVTHIVVFYDDNSFESFYPG